MEAPPSIEQTCSGDTESSNTSRAIVTSSPPDPNNHVFISVDSTVGRLRTLLSKQGEYITFIRAPVASGKTTLAKFLVKNHPNEFVLVDSLQDTSEDWYEEFVTANGTSVRPGQTCSRKDAKKALIEIGRQGKTIVIDEAHQLFAFKDVVSLLTKGLEMATTRPKVLLFSVSGSTVSKAGTDILTPAEINYKFVWYPPPPDNQNFSEHLKCAGVHLTPEAVGFFVKLCGGNRGVIMHAMDWVRMRQNNSPSEGEQKTWDEVESANQVRNTFADSSCEKKVGGTGWGVGLKSHFESCRAVKVNGQYSNISAIPNQFGLVLFGGPKNAEDLLGTARQLTVAGFLFPQKTAKDESEFVPYNWSSSGAKYAVPNPIMATYYNDRLPKFGMKRKFSEEMWKPESGLCFLARALPYLTFESVVNPPRLNIQGGLQNSLSIADLRYEDNYNKALASIFGELGFKVSTPENCKTGKPDIVITYESNKTCVIESIMTKQTQEEHVQHVNRFINEKLENYAGDHQVLLTIGSSEQLVKSRVQETSQIVLDKNAKTVEIVGIAVSLLHNSHLMILPGGSSSILFTVDLVAKSIQNDDRGRPFLVPVQHYEYVDTQTAKRPRP